MGPRKYSRTFHIFLTLEFSGISLKNTGTAFNAPSYLEEELPWEEAFCSQMSTSWQYIAKFSDKNQSLTWTNFSLQTEHDFNIIYDTSAGYVQKICNKNDRSH